MVAAPVGLVFGEIAEGCDICRQWDGSLVYARQTGEGSCATLTNGGPGNFRNLRGVEEFSESEV